MILFADQFEKWISDCGHFDVYKYEWIIDCIQNHTFLLKHEMTEQEQKQYFFNFFFFEVQIGYFFFV